MDDKILKRKKTRFKDCNNDPIYIGDYLHVQEYQDDDERSFGSLDYYGIVEEWDNYGIVVAWYGNGFIPEIESIKCFPKSLRRKVSEEEYKNDINW